MSRQGYILVDSEKELIRLVWKQALVLLSIASSSTPQSIVTESVWKDCATEYANNFTKCFSVTVSSYFHCLVYHYGWFLTQFSGIEYLSNYSIETNIHWIKKNTFTSTNHFGGKNANSCWGQLIEKHLRCQDSFIASLQKKKTVKENWADTVLMDDDEVPQLSVFTFGRLLEKSLLGLEESLFGNPNES